MKTKSVLYIDIPHPCNQDWNVMQKNGTGKYCTQCNNIVYDFSRLNDDELLMFLAKHQNLNCGRFHNSQLKRPILPFEKKQKLSFERVRKIAATFLAILTFKPGNLKAENSHVKHPLVFDSKFKKTDFIFSGKISITGIVKDESGTPLEKVSVTFGTIQTVLTDAEGKFSFELDNINGENHIIYFELDGFITAVRSYHVAMQSTSYNVTLDKKGSGGEFHTAGIMMFPGIVRCANFDIFFKPNQSKLTVANKSFLDNFSTTLKNYPEASIDIKANCISLGKNYALVKKRAETIKQYLVNNNGISSERLFIKILRSGGDTDTINILDHTDEH